MSILKPKALKEARDNLIAAHGNTPEARRLFFEDVAHGVCNYHTTRYSSQSVAELTVPTSTVTGGVYGDPLEAFNEVNSLDNGWMAAYDMLDFTNTTKSGFDVNTFTNSIVIAAVEPGENAKIFTVSGTQNSVQFIAQRGGYAYDNTWWDDEQFWKMNEQAEAMIGAANRNKATIAYGIIETAADIPADVAFGGSGGDSQAVRDAETIYDGVVAIVQDTEDEGIGATIDSPFVLFAPLELQRRYRTALAITENDVTVNIGSSSFKPGNIVLVATNRLASTTKGRLCLPGRQTKWGDRQNMTVEEDSDIQKNARVVISTERYNGVAGNTNQFRTLLTS